MAGGHPITGNNGGLMSTPPIALTIAGSDSGGGAGIQADLKTFSALGVYGASVLTALTAQNTREVRAIQDVDPEFIGAQLACVFDDLPVRAVKIGMLSQVPVIEVIADVLENRDDVPVVLDPVMVAKSGDRLLHREAVDSLRRRLLPRAALITPNLPEAAVLLNCPAPQTREEMQQAAHWLRRIGAPAVLIKGGHMSAEEDEESADYLLSADHARWFSAPRIDTGNTHGTGCTLSSAIAAGLALGRDLETAVHEAKAYTSDAIAAAGRLRVGSGHGPVHHFHRWW